MKPENYSKNDIPVMLETKRTILHQLENIEVHLWTDDIETALKRTLDMHLALVKLNHLQSNKRLENICNVIKLHNAGVRIINFGHKKAD